MSYSDILLSHAYVIFQFVTMLFHEIKLLLLYMQNLGEKFSTKHCIILLICITQKTHKYCNLATSIHARIYYVICMYNWLMTGFPMLFSAPTGSVLWVRVASGSFPRSALRCKQVLYERRGIEKNIRKEVLFFSIYWCIHEYLKIL